MIFYPLTGDIFTTFSVTLLFQVGIHRLKEEFTRFEFYGRTSGDHYRSTCLGFLARRCVCGLGISVPNPTKYDFLIFRHTLSYDLDVSINTFFASCFCNPVLSAKASISSALFINANFLNC